VKAFTTAYKKAAKQISREMETKLRESAAQEGWGQASYALTVGYGENGMSVGHAEGAATVVFDLEFGTQEQSGKGTIHRFKNNTREPLDRFSELFEAYVVKELKKR
jgi:hypothetical protein